MPYHREYAKQAFKRHPRHYGNVRSTLFKDYIWSDTGMSAALDRRIHDLAMWCQEEPVGLYRQIYNNKQSFKSAVGRPDVVFMKHDVHVREAEIVYRPSKKLMGELEMLDGLFRVLLRDKYLQSSGSHFDHLQDHHDYDRLVYNMDMHRREGNPYTNIPYTETLWFQLRALKLYWDALITKGEDVDVSNLLRFTTKTLVDVEHAIHNQQFHSSDRRTQSVDRDEVGILHEFAAIIRVVEKEGLRMQVLGEIWSSGFEGVSFKLKAIYRTICGHNYEPRAAWLKKEGQLYLTYISDIECVYQSVSAYERNMLEPFIQYEVVTRALDRLRKLLQLDYLQDVQDFVDVYELWKRTVNAHLPAYIPPVAPAAQGWQPSWATGTQTQEMRELLDGL